MASSPFNASTSRGVPTLPAGGTAWIGLRPVGLIQRAGMHLPRGVQDIVQIMAANDVCLVRPRMPHTYFYADGAPKKRGKTMTCAPYVQPAINPRASVLGSSAYSDFVAIFAVSH